MPDPSSFRVRWLPYLALFLVVAFTAFIYFNASRACIAGPHKLRICAASDMARIPNRGEFVREHPHFNLGDGALQLVAARNETIAFQVILRNDSDQDINSLQIETGDFKGESDSLSRDHIQPFLAYYHWVEPGGYTWGTKSKVLPWPDFYPDALVPFTMRCLNDATPVVQQVSVAKQTNQSVWFDIYIPKHRAPGSYQGRLTIRSGDEIRPIDIELEVVTASLPEVPTIDAVGELYSAYAQEGVGEDLTSPLWKRMAQCYQQLAHRHRMVFIERFNRAIEADEDAQSRHYAEAFGPMLSGRLFNPSLGYLGPGTDTPVKLWRTPWPQPYNGRLEQPLAPQDLSRYANLARSWREQALANGWNFPWYFAYLFDEVDGPTDEEDLAGSRPEYLQMVHGEMRRVQQALDGDGKTPRIHLLWTSHSDPSRWLGQPGIDLVGTIRHWVPNAAAANPDFLTARRKAGEKVWFYHTGHPFVGIHSINASGIEMRTWGVIATRYGLDGQLMWALNLGDDKQPYHHPSYKRDDDRVGNGTLVYPGRRLDSIGLPSVPGPVPSMRLKAWRRGLQDAELIALARQTGHQAAVDKLVSKMMPRALAQASGSPSWPNRARAWIEFRLALLALASGKDG